jgi:hypothetical protein
MSFIRYLLSVTKSRTWKAVLMSFLVVAAALPLLAGTPDLSGTYSADDGGIYFLQQDGNTLWWAGFSLDAGLPGSVLSSTNTAIVGTTVSLLTPSKSVAETAITDSSGFYYFADTTGLTRGSNYTLKVTVPKGYKGVTPASQIFTWSAISVLTNFVVQ